jgi:hypothetical protein
MAREGFNTNCTLLAESDASFPGARGRLRGTSWKHDHHESGRAGRPRCAPSTEFSAPSATALAVMIWSCFPRSDFWLFSVTTAALLTKLVSCANCTEPVDTGHLVR